jgi:[NiFe] hydrogenase diaphorase moiety small subunit
MTDKINLTIDGKTIQGEPGQTIMEAARESGVYIPHLCYHKDLVPHGSCRVCTVIANGRAQSACTQPIAEGMIVENDTEQLKQLRQNIIDMLFVEGNHFCMFCEKSGNCELQALAYRLGIAAPKYPYMFPDRDIDASHPDIFIDRNRCILCGRCVRASRDLDGKHVFEFVGRGKDKRVAVNAEANLADTDASATDKAVEVCPTGSLVRKRVGYAVPVGQRMYDHKPIGSEVEQAGH